MNIFPRKILMAHGDKEERGKLAIMLARFGHCISFADAISRSKFCVGEYDLNIVDEHLAQSAWFAFLQHLSSENQAKTIFLSSEGKKERRLFRDSMGIYECLQKPVIPIDLAVVVCDFFISCFPNTKIATPMSL